MNTTYLVWKCPTIGGRQDNWCYLTASDFFAFKKDKLNRHRYFVELPGQLDSDSDIFVEATKAQYMNWLKEKNRSDYLQRFAKNFVRLSLEGLIETHGCDGFDFMHDLSADIEEQVLQRIELEALADALAELDCDERWLINELFFNNRSQRSLVEVLSISQQAISKQEKNILQKLKFLVVETQKSQQ